MQFTCNRRHLSSCMFRVFAQYFNPQHRPTYYFMTIFHFTFIAVHIRFSLRFSLSRAIFDPVFSSSSSKVYDLLYILDGYAQVKFGRLSFHFTILLYLLFLSCSLGKNKATITIKINLFRIVRQQERRRWL